MLKHGGKPAVEREVIEDTFFDEFILDICGVETNTTLTQRITTTTFPDGSQTVHVVAEFVPDDRRIASERDAFTDVVAPDGTLTTKGLAIRLCRQGEGTIIREPDGFGSWRTASWSAGRIRFSTPTRRTSSADGIRDGAGAAPRRRIPTATSSARAPLGG